MWDQPRGPESRLQAQFEGRSASRSGSLGGLERSTAQGGGQWWRVDFYSAGPQAPPGLSLGLFPAGLSLLRLSGARPLPPPLTNIKTPRRSASWTSTLLLPSSFSLVYPLKTPAAGFLSLLLSTLPKMSADKEFTYSDVSEHASKKDLYIVVHDKVYNCTSFVDEHP